MPVNVRLTGGPNVVVRSLEVALRAARDDETDRWVVSTDTGTTDAPDVVVVVSLGSSVPLEIDLTRRQHPAARMVWLAGDPDSGDIAEAISRGVSTVVTQRSGLDDLLSGIEHASHGRSWTSPDVVGALLDQLRSPRPIDRGGLTDREVEVLTLLRAGRSTRDIAAELYISAHTAKNHVRRILRKLDAHSRLEAVAIADRRRLLDPA